MLIMFDLLHEPAFWLQRFAVGPCLPKLGGARHQDTDSGGRL